MASQSGVDIAKELQRVPFPPINVTSVRKCHPPAHPKSTILASHNKARQRGRSLAAQQIPSEKDVESIEFEISWNIWNMKHIYSISSHHITPDSRTHWLFTSFAHLFLSANLQHMSLSMAWSLLSQALIFGDSKTKKKWSPSAWQVEWKRSGQRIHHAWRDSNNANMQTVELLR